MSSDYGVVDRFLHRLVLGARPIAEMGFSVDQKLARADGSTVKDGHHVFVCGLARAGTTILMRRIHDSGQFRSLTYADMPFVLAPNLWNRLRSSAVKRGRSGERSHGDGIEVNAESPESLDEVFWRVFDGEAYIEDDRLVPHRPSDAVLARYRDYVAAVLAASPDGVTRYLSKNNNNILRLPSLRRAFPAATILLPFRDPLAHADSLLAQHHRFVARHERDRFARAYMGWLVHHEFGGDHRPFATHERPAEDPGTLAYWLRTWIGANRWILATAPEYAVFVCYEDLCDASRTWDCIAARLDLSGGTDGQPFRRGRSSAGDAGLDPSTVGEAYALYDAMRERSSRI